jgi:hypothetical protein
MKECPACAILGILALALLVLLGVGVYLQHPDPNALTHETFLAQLNQTNHTILDGGHSDYSDMLSGERYVLTIDGEPVQVWEYISEGAAKRNSDRIGKDGSQIKMGFGGAAIVDWIAPPHFYRKGNIIVLYNGVDETILATLETLLGPQFAGQ